MSILFFILAVICYTLSQWVIHRGYSVSTESDSFWGINSWKRKYKFPEDPPNNWYYKLFKIKYKERFPGSATIFVTLTDGYHLTQFGFKAFICASITFYKPILEYWDALGHFVLFGLVYSVLYRLLK